MVFTLYRIRRDDRGLRIGEGQVTVKDFPQVGLFAPGTLGVHTHKVPWHMALALIRLSKEVRMSPVHSSVQEAGTRVQWLLTKSRRRTLGVV